MILFRATYVQRMTVHMVRRYRKSPRTLSSSSTLDYYEIRKRHRNQIENLPEWQATLALTTFLENKTKVMPVANSEDPGDPIILRQRSVLVDSILSTFCLHVESRIAALLGMGFYTIGPCGEETLAAMALPLKPQDSIALHYRHSAISLARQLLLLSLSATTEPETTTTATTTTTMLQKLLLDRARGYTVSSHDPNTGGVHCSIGGSGEQDHNFIVTSTLASQCSPAVGRALATAFLPTPPQATTTTTTTTTTPVSLVTLGDGSIHHAHFWSAFHLARHARHLRIKCPVVFAISDNGISISYFTRGYAQTLFHNDPLIPLFVADGNSIYQVADQSTKALEYSRKHKAPAVILVQNLNRRFGHAATDRQAAYMAETEIRHRAESDLLHHAIVEAVEGTLPSMEQQQESKPSGSFLTYTYVLQRFLNIQSWTQQAFAQAVTEPKVTRNDMMHRVSGWLSQRMPTKTSQVEQTSFPNKTSGDNDPGTLEPVVARAVMRKHVTRGFAEIMAKDDTVIYLGEDVRHGGYYLVTDGLAQQFPHRVIDFPPEETALLGAALGLAQQGLLPIVEIPYAKYMDCAADMMAEIAILPWLTNQPADPAPPEKTKGGMLVRIQGFDRGLFGGNFHTHNSLYNILHPGVEVLCYSNGYDYVRGLRYAMEQIKKFGRIIVFVDCTHLLNLRHVFTNDRRWETPYPDDNAKEVDFFDTVRIYRDDRSERKKKADLAIVSYGNGVVTALQARPLIARDNLVIDVLDCPCLNRIPQGLLEALPNYDCVLFADICKQGPGSVFASMAIELLQYNVHVTAAPRTYNPLGSYVTFLNVKDIVDAANQLLENKK